MKRYLLFLLVLTVIITSCDSTGTSSVQKSIDMKDYLRLVNLCEKYKGNPEKSVALGIGLEELQAVYNYQPVAKEYFSDILWRSESESTLAEIAVVSIVSNCDTNAFMDLVSMQKHLHGDPYLQRVFEEYSNEGSCTRMAHYISILSSINYSIDDTIKYYHSKLDKIDTQSLLYSMEKDNVDKQVEEMSTGRQYYFYVIAANIKSALEKTIEALESGAKVSDDNEYEVVPMKEEMEFLISSRYSQFKGSEDLKASMFEKRHATLLTDSKDIGKGLYRFYAYKSATRSVETIDGFNQDWDVYQHVEYDEWNSLKEQVVKYEADLQELEVSRASIESLIEKLELEKQGYSQLF